MIAAKSVIIGFGYEHTLGNLFLHQRLFIAGWK